MNESNQSNMFTPRELAAFLNISLKWVTKHTQARRIPGQVKIGRVWRYRKTDIEKRLLTGALLLNKTNKIY